jgi:DNA polymerase III epsilon subunit-like protein
VLPPAPEGGAVNLPFSAIVIDLETAGDPGQRVVEIGAVRLDDQFRITDEYEALVDGRPVSQEVIRIHGITEAMLEGKPTFIQVHRAFETWCEQFKPYVFFSWSDFDHCTLRDEYRRLSLRYPHSGHAFDLKSLVWWTAIRNGFPARTFPVDRALSILGIPFEGQRHRALPDARMEAKLLQYIIGNTLIFSVA